MLDAKIIKEYLGTAKKLDTKVQPILNYLAELNAELVPIIEAKQELEAYLKNLVLEGGQNISTEHSKAEIISPFTRKSWDTRRLEELAENMPNLLLLRRETQVGQNVRLTYKQPVDN